MERQYGPGSGAAIVQEQRARAARTLGVRLLDAVVSVLSRGGPGRKSIAVRVLDATPLTLIVMIAGMAAVVSTATLAYAVGGCDAPPCGEAAIPAEDQSVPPGHVAGQVPSGQAATGVPPGQDAEFVPPARGPQQAPSGEDVPPGHDPGHTPPGQDPGHTPPGHEPGHTPPGQDPGHTPPGQDPAETPPGQDAGHSPPGQEPGHTPPGQDPADTPPGHDPGHTPPGQDPDQKRPDRDRDEVPPSRGPDGDKGEPGGGRPTKPEAQGHQPDGPGGGASGAGASSEGGARPSGPSIGEGAEVPSAAPAVPLAEDDVSPSVDTAERDPLLDGLADAADEAAAAARDAEPRNAPPLATSFDVRERPAVRPALSVPRDRATVTEERRAPDGSDRDEAGGRTFDRIAEVAVETATRFRFPLLLLISVGLYLLLQRRFDETDPKLASAPVRREELQFEQST